jgi:hypothetical protein
LLCVRCIIVVVSSFIAGLLYLPRFEAMGLQAAAAPDELGHRILTVEEGFSRQHSSAAVAVKEGGVPTVAIGEGQDDSGLGQ